MDAMNRFQKRLYRIEFPRLGVVRFYVETRNWEWLDMPRAQAAQFLRLLRSAETFTSETAY